MSIVYISVDEAGEVGELPRTNKLISTDSLSTISTSGYLNKNNTSGRQIFPTDIWHVQYNYTGNSFAQQAGFGTGTFGIFTTSVSTSGVITLTEWTNPGDVLLPVTSGNFPVFNGTAGQIKDSGAAPTNVSDQFVVMSPGSLTAGHLLKAGDANGSVADQGVQMKTVAQAAVAGGAAAQTVTDTFCTTASMVTASWNDTTNAVTIQKVAAGNGSFVVTSSADPGASHLNYVIFK